MGNRILNFIYNLNVSKCVFLGGLSILALIFCLVVFVLIKLQLWLSEKRNGYLILPILSVLCTCIFIIVYVTGICIDDLIIIGYFITMLSSIISIVIALMILTNKE